MKIYIHKSLMTLSPMFLRIFLQPLTYIMEAVEANPYHWIKLADLMVILLRRFEKLLNSLSFTLAFLRTILRHHLVVTALFTFLIVVLTKVGD